MNADRMTVGWREWVSLPGLGVDLIKVKVDTGARTSSLHTEDMGLFQKDDQDWVRFVIHPKQRTKAKATVAEVRLVEWRRVRSSSGESEIRPVIRTPLRIGEQEWEIELTLTDRDIMGFRMLVGREAIRSRAVVDPGRSYLTRKLKKRRRVEPQS